MHNRSARAFTLWSAGVLNVLGCGVEPLSPIPESTATNALRKDEPNKETGGGDGGVSDPTESRVPALTDEGGDDTNVDEENRRDRAPLFCADGAVRSSWTDTLPERAAADVPSTLEPGSDAVWATCEGDDVLRTGSEWGGAASSNGHVRGRYYFEAETLTFEAGWSAVGVFAAPASVFDIGLGTAFQEQVSAGGGPVEEGTMGIAVDLDAGVVAVFSNGQLRTTATIALLPGVGAYHAAASPMPGVDLALNFGSQPFAFMPPAGYAAWNSNENGSAGSCTTVSPAPSLRAPITVSNTEGYVASTFSTDAEDPIELVVLGAYDTGSAANWTWGTDENGNVVEVPVDGARTGSALVTVDRAGPIALVLSAYEPTDWTLDVVGDAQIVSVSVYGMHAQTVSGVPDGVPVDLHAICADRNGGGNCTAPTGESFPIAPHQWPFDTGGGDTQGFIRHVEEQLCLPLKHFGGAYLARTFTVE